VAAVPRTVSVIASCGGPGGSAADLLELLAASGMPGPVTAGVPTGHHGCAVLDWAATGAMGLTGWPDGPPLAPAAPVMTRVRGAATMLGGLTAAVGSRVDLDPSTVLCGRAALLGLDRRGRTSVGGACRLVRAADGWVALSLARPADVEALPAAYGLPIDVASAAGHRTPAAPGPAAGADAANEPWASLAAVIATLPAEAAADRGQLLGIPAAALVSAAGEAPASPWRIEQVGRAAPRAVAGDLTVVDLSAMWAGPLCAHLLGRAGFRVIKVESRERPDGARAGDPRFFDWLHGGHDGVTVDLATAAGRDLLRRLVDRADVVIEGSRPRALAQLGIEARSVVSDRPGRTWVSITGYGRDDDGAARVAFGDDAAVAGGLVARDRAGGPVFAADAIADPLTGVLAAVAAVASVMAGGGRIVDVAMARVAGWAAGIGDEPVPHALERDAGGRWAVRCRGAASDGMQEVVAAEVPNVGRRGPEFGRPAERLLAELGVA